MAPILIRPRGITVLESNAIESRKPVVDASSAGRTESASFPSQHYASVPPGLRLTNDLVFKALFSRHLHLLSDLINAVLQWPSPVTVVKVLNPDILPRHVNGKRIVMDILVRDATNAVFIIEMQVRREEPWPERNVYYLVRGLSEQLQAGQDYEGLRPVIGISLLAHDLFPEYPQQALWRLALRDEQTPAVCFKEALQLHIMELPKAERLGDLPPELRAWIACLLHNLDEATMKQITHPPVQETLQHLQTLSADEKLRWAALQHDIAMLDERTALNRATRKGVEQGLAQGREEGIQQGQEQGRQAHAVLTLNTLLLRKFKHIPDTIQDRIATAGLPALQQWTINVLDADQIEDVFKPPR
ncbi:Rpn family recombination-promoting nuclease/putative transposase [Alcaligenaceae bacterium SJ-26]|nr:Rpn family recombination-promoting nuclease/putative transposase [Alcaligenaceae bacterium SJ-26]